MSTKHDVAELSGAHLDLAVAIAQGSVDAALRGEDDDGNPVCMLGDPSDGKFYAPSSDWSQGGPIIERYVTAIAKGPTVPGNHVTGAAPDAEWDAFAYIDLNHKARYRGQTILVAAMRAYVASKFGETVELP